MAKLELPENPELASKVLDARAQDRDRGMIGYIFGARHNAPTNIGGAVALLGMVALLVVSFANLPDPNVRPDLMKIFAAIVISALGYVFGSITSSKS